jgi:predicted Zn-dependent protease
VIPRSLMLSMAGLGALAASCSGMKLPSVPNTPAELARRVGTATRSFQGASECEKLKADISAEEEYSLGGAVAINWVQRGGGLMLADDAGQKLHRYINVVGRNLGAQSPRPTLKWTFGVLRDVESFDAVSAPGGYIFVTRGLLQGVENEAQLAGVLAHEIAHVTSKHALARYTEVKVEQCKLAMMLQGGNASSSQAGADLPPGAADVLVGSTKGSGGGLDLDRNTGLLGRLTDKAVDTLVANGYGKEDEFAADELAVRLLVSAGYDPQEYIRFLAKIPDSRRGFANHPRKVDRVKRLVALLDAGKKTGDEFPELAVDTEGLVKPTLPPEFAAVKSAVAHDQP